jgi:type II secretion system protein H
MNPQSQKAVGAPGRLAGFTFIELLLVVLVLAIAAALVVPALGDSATTRLRQAGRLLAADLRYARSAAIARGSDPRLVVFDPHENTYHIAAQSSPTQPITRPNANQPYQVQFGIGRASELDGIAIQSTSLGNNNDRRLAFGRYGSTDQPEPATVTLACEGHTITVTVHPATGEVAVGNLN